MDARFLSAALSVGPQITPAELPAIAMAGFRSVICTRPDGEEDGQPSFAQIAEAARAAGLSAHHVPIAGPPAPDAVAAFAMALSQTTGPTFAYCRTGTRAAMLWALTQAGTRPAASILSSAQSAGYDLTALAPRLETATAR